MPARLVVTPGLLVWLSFSWPLEPLSSSEAAVLFASGEVRDDSALDEAVVAGCDVERLGEAVLCGAVETSTLLVLAGELS